MSSNSQYSMSLFMYGLKNYCQALVSQFQGLIDTLFHYLESVGKCSEAYQTNQGIEISE